jgi:hypothetical protein
LTIAGVLEPNPRIVLLPERASRVIAAIATVAGVLEYMLIIDVPSLTLVVAWVRAPRVE